MIATDTLDALTAEVAVNAAVAHLRGFTRSDRRIGHGGLLERRDRR